MGRADKTLDPEAPAYELARFMRELRVSSCMTLREIGELGHVGHSTLSQNSDGRFRSWPPMEQWFIALYLAAAAKGRTLPIGLPEALERARQLWEVASARTRGGSRQKHTGAADSVANGSPIRLPGPRAAARAAMTGGSPSRYDRSGQAGLWDRVEQLMAPPPPRTKPKPAVPLLGLQQGGGWSRATPVRGPVDEDYWSPMHVEHIEPEYTTAQALRELIASRRNCSRCAPPARQSALDSDRIRRVLAGDIEPTRHDIQRILVACGCEHNDLRMWKRIITAVHDAPPHS